jgi:Protein of unknown function (DUF4058)
MPIHDWTRVEAGIFHAFHHSWIEEMARALNGGLLPGDYYALAEQVLTLQEDGADEGDGTGRGNLRVAPKLKPTAETEMAFYRRKQDAIAVRHVSGDSLVAVVEIVSPGNKSSRTAMRKFVEKAAALLEQDIHLLIVDLQPPGRRDPQGIHGAIWEEIAGEEYSAPADKRLTVAAYECALSVRAYVVHVAVGDVLPEMPLFLEPQVSVDVPLETTYQSAFAAVPRRWRRVLEI